MSSDRTGSFPDFAVPYFEPACGHAATRELDLPGEVMALTMLAGQTAANLGWLDEAVENAVLASALAGDLPASRLQPMAQNYLGVAFFWCRDYARAEEGIREVE